MIRSVAWVVAFRFLNLKNGFPERYVRVRYTPLLDVKIRDDLTMEILVDPNLPSRGRDQATGYPCFA